MPFIDTTVEDINALLLTSIFSKGKLQGSSLLELAYIQKREQSDGKFDYVVQGVDETDMTPDGSYPCIIYHRMLSGAFNIQPGFGDTNNTREPTQMTLVVWDKRTIDIHESTLASWIADTLNKTYAQTEITDTGLSKLETRAVSVTYDSALVWANEYKNQNYPFGVEEVMFFSIQYIIESTYTKGCFATCPEC